MPIRASKSYLLASLLLACSLLPPLASAEDTAKLDIAEFHQILDAINQANIPDNVKDQLYRDMKNSMIENVRRSKIAEEIKQVLIKDLESISRE